MKQLFDSIIYRLRHNTCYFRKLTGFYCPGCGATRSVKFLLKGDLLHCFIYHPAVLYIILIAILLIIQLYLNHIKHPDGPKTRLLKPIHGYILIAVILVQCLIKNLLLLMGINILNIPISAI